MRMFIQLFYHTKCFIRAPVSGYEPYGLLRDPEMMRDECDDSFICRIPFGFFFYIGLEFPRRRFGEPPSSGFRLDFHSYQHGCYSRLYFPINSASASMCPSIAARMSDFDAPRGRSSIVSSA